jgi:hypothetical protein
VGVESGRVIPPRKSEAEAWLWGWGSGAAVKETYYGVHDDLKVPSKILPFPHSFTHFIICRVQDPYCDFVPRMLYENPLPFLTESPALGKGGAQGAEWRDQGARKNRKAPTFEP